MLITIKFGGTSVGNADRIRAAAELVSSAKAQGHQVVVVTSAMSGVTNRLVALAERAAADGFDEGSQVMESFRFTRELEIQHLNEARKAIRNAQLVENVAQSLYAERHGLERVLFGSNLLGELSPIGFDYVVSAGERMCVPILANSLRDIGIEAVGVGGDDAGILTDNNYGSAVPNMERTRQEVRHSLLPLVSGGKIPVVAGFYGRSEAGRIAILGRGGSDYSATLIGCALDADEIWIMTDVDGIKTTDPRLVPAARTLPQVSYVIAAEMAHLGAKVLHPKSVMPAARQRIPLRIASSFEPEKAGTRLVPSVPATGASVAALTLVRKSALVRATSADGDSDVVVKSGVLEEIRNHNIDVLASATGFNGSNLLWLVGSLELERFSQILQAHENGQFQTDIQRNVAVLGVVGDHVATAARVLARVAGCLEEADATPLAVLQGATPNSIVIALPDNEQQLSAALVRLHTELGLDMHSFENAISRSDIANRSSLAGA